MKQIATCQKHENDQYWNSAIRSQTEPFQTAHQAGDEGSLPPPVGELAQKKMKSFHMSLFAVSSQVIWWKKAHFLYCPDMAGDVKKCCCFWKKILQGKWQVVHFCKSRFTDLKTQSLGAQLLLHSLSYHVLQEMLFFWEIGWTVPYSAGQSYSILPQRFFHRSFLHLLLPLLQQI